LNERLDRFVYSTSHDLRPLLSVLGLLKLAEGQVDKKEMSRYQWDDAESPDIA